MSHLVTLADSLPLSPAFHLMPHCFLWVRTVLKTFGMTQLHNYSKIYDQGRLDCHGSHFSSKNVAVLASFFCVFCARVYNQDWLSLVCQLNKNSTVKKKKFEPEEGISYLQIRWRRVVVRTPAPTCSSRNKFIHNIQKERSQRERLPVCCHLNPTDARLPRWVFTHR